MAVVEVVLNVKGFVVFTVDKTRRADETHRVIGTSDYPALQEHRFRWLRGPIWDPRTLPGTTSHGPR